MTYREKLLLPEWRLRRGEILEQRNYTCERCGSSGVLLEVHHLRYLDGRDPWDYPDQDLQALCRRCHALISPKALQQVIPGLEEMHENIKELTKIVRMMATQHAMPRFTHAPKPGPPRFDTDQVYRWIRKHQPNEQLHRPLIKFARWLFNTGTTNHDAIFVILKDFLARQPSSPYAYYAPNGPARDVRTAQHNAKLSEVENEAFKAADRKFLAH